MKPSNALNKKRCRDLGESDGKSLLKKKKAGQDRTEPTQGKNSPKEISVNSQKEGGESNSS